MSAEELIPNARVKVTRVGFHVVRPDEILRISGEMAVVLELFTHSSSESTAFERYLSVAEEYVSTSISGPTARIDSLPDEGIGIVFKGSKVFRSPLASLEQCFRDATSAYLANQRPSVSADEVSRSTISLSPFLEADVTFESLQSPIVPELARFYHEPSSFQRLTRAEFQMLVEYLRSLGLLVLPVGSINLGSFANGKPFCHEFGYTRGTPIDRVFLDVFIDTIRDQVYGATLEIGGRKEDKSLYRFQNAEPFETLDVEAGSGADHVGDAHCITLFRPGSWDSILAFNVLEHCERPWIVVSNFLYWLRPGGMAFCVVPNAQRLHRGPRDYWRILPDAASSLFSDFEEVTILRYGNLLTSQAAMSGIAAEELHYAMAYSDRDYPTVTCISARKAY